MTRARPGNRPKDLPERFHVLLFKPILESEHVAWCHGRCRRRKSAQLRPWALVNGDLLELPGLCRTCAGEFAALSGMDGAPAIRRYDRLCRPRSRRPGAATDGVVVQVTATHVLVWWRSSQRSELRWIRRDTVSRAQDTILLFGPIAAQHLQPRLPHWSKWPTPPKAK